MRIIIIMKCTDGKLEYAVHINSYYYSLIRNVKKLEKNDEIGRPTMPHIQ